MRRSFALLALVATLAACEASAEIQVRENGSGTFGFSFVIEDQFLQVLEGFGGGGDPFDEFRKSLADGPVKFDVREFPVTGGRGIRATASFKNVAELKKLIADAERADPSADNPFAGGPGFGTFTLERRGGGWYFEAVSEAPDLGDLGGLGGGSDDVPIDTDQLASLLKVSFKVTLPGASVRSTADDVKPSGGSTGFTWKADLTSDKPMDMVAVTKAGASFPVAPVAAAAAAIIIGGFVTLMMKRKSAAVAPDAPAGDAWPPPPSDPIAGMGDGPGSSPDPGAAPPKP